MNPEFSKFEGLLTQLGEARRSGAFSVDAMPYPWKAEQVITIQPVRRFSWMRVASLSAAAAAVAFLFVGPKLLNHSQERQGLGGLASSDASLEPSVIVVAESPAPVTAANDDCDFNGDGKVNGADIQSLTNLLAAGTVTDPQRVEDLKMQFLRCAKLGR